MQLHQIVRTENTMPERPAPKDANVGEGASGDEGTPTKAPMPEIDDPELVEIDESDTTPVLGADTGEDKE